MGNILLLFLVLFPMLLSAWVFPLRRRDRRYRNWLIQIIPAVELAAALLLLLWPGAALELPGVFGFGLRLQAGSLGEPAGAGERLPVGGHRPQLPQLLCRRRGL